MIRRYTLAITFLIFTATITETYAVVYPTLTPTGEITGGAFQKYFDNMYTTTQCTVSGKVVGGFSPAGVPNCVSPVSSGLFLIGQTAGDTIYFNGTDWARTDNIYNLAGNVGIGTNTPTAKLDVNGQIRIGGGSPAAGRILISDATGISTWQDPLNSLSGSFWAIGGSPVISMEKIGTTTNFNLPFITNNIERMRILTNGNVGIGVTNPTAMLELAGQIKINGGTPGAGKVLTSDATGLASWVTPTVATASNTLGLTGSLIGTVNYVAKYTPTGTGINNSQIYDNGTNIGIGTTTPGAKFDIVGGDMRVNGVTVGLGTANIASNTVLGVGALYSNVSGGNSVAIGYQSLYFNTTGYYNTAVGPLALQFNNLGYYNTAVGTVALYQNTSGNFNTAYGVQSLNANTIGSSNVANGYNTLAGNLSGDNNTAIGTSAGSNITTGSSNIAIGYNAQVLSATSSNQLSIGNWIYGTSGNIGIGTNNPGAKLEVAGQIKITGGSAGSGKVLVSDATGLASWQSSVPASSVNASNITGGVPDYITKFGSGGVGIYQSLFYETGARIGLGNTNPGYTLDVTGTGNFVGFRLPTGAGAGKVLISDATGGASWSTTISGATATGITGGVADYLTKFGTGGVGIYQSLFYETGARIGLGNTNPGYTLDVTGTGNFIGFRLPTGAGAGKVLTSDASGGATWSSALSGATATGITGGTQNYVPKFGTGGTGLYSSQIFDTGTGVGIGTVAPSAALDVNGQIRLRTGSASGLYLISDAVGVGSWTSSVTATSLSVAGSILGSTLYYNGTNWVPSTNIYNSGANIGIGTSTPSEKLTVSGSAWITGDITVQGKVITDTIVNRTVANVSISGSLLPDALAPLVYRDIGSSAQKWNNLYLAGQVTIAGGSPGLGKILTSDATGLATWGYTFSGSTTASGIVGGTQNYITKFGTGGNGLYNSQLFESGVYIGIGTTNPGAKLDIAGTLKVTDGSQGLGKILTSDANGLATWSSGFSGTTTASGITGGTEGYITKFGTGGNGIVNSLFYETGAYVALGSTTPTSRFEIWSGATTTLFHMRGSNNLGIGSAAVRYQTTGSSNVGIGPNALRTLTTGYSNAGVGEGALYGNTQGYFNAALGAQALYSNTIGNWNVAMGNQALWTNLDGAYNVALGGQALYSNSANDNNIAIGYQALRSTVADNNIAIGFSAGSGLTSGTNNIIIGTNAQAQSNTASNQLNIGGWIYGSGGNIGIGQSNPVAKLDISGTIKITGGTPGLGKVLMSDATGLATWSSTLSGATATGITGGTQNYVSKFGTGGTGLYASQIFDDGTNIGVGTGTSLTTKFVIDSGIANDSGLRFTRLTSVSPVVSNGIISIGVDSSGKVVGVSPVSNIAVYTGTLRSAPPNPNPNLNTFEVSYDFNQYFGIPGKQSFVVSKGDGPSNNGPYFKENGTDALCSITGTYGSPGTYDCANADPATGLSASPYNSFTMSAKGDTFGYQLALGARGDAPLFARSGRFNGSQTGGLYTNDAPYQTPAPWQRVLSLPANHPEYLYINTGLNSQLQAQTGGGRVGIGTTTPTSRFEVWTGATTDTLLHFRGTQNVGLGLAGLNSTVSGIRNTGIGASALDLVSSGNGNTALGYSAGSNITTGSSNIMIGSGALAQSATASNQLNIGNWLYGSGGYIGIGVSNPGSALEVNGQIKVTGGTPGLGKVLTSDATGLATWQTPATVPTMGVCTIAAVVISNTATARTCTGVPASTAVAVNCSPSGAFSTPNTTALFCRADGTLNSVTCNTTAANTNSLSYKCMWAQ